MLGSVCAITFRTVQIFGSFLRKMVRRKSLGAVRSRIVVKVVRRRVSLNPGSGETKQKKAETQFLVKVVCPADCSTATARKMH